MCRIINKMNAKPVSLVKKTESMVIIVHTRTQEVRIFDKGEN
jgi:hypothetical protein